MLSNFIKCLQSHTCKRIASSSVHRRYTQQVNSGSNVIGIWKEFADPSWSVQKFLVNKTALKGGHNLSPADLQRIADLSYLHVPPERLLELSTGIDNILESVATMSEIDTTSVPPLMSILEDYKLKTREDVPRATTSNSEDSKMAMDENQEEVWGSGEIPEPVILKNASEKEFGFFVVPKQKQPWEEMEEVDPSTDDAAELKKLQPKRSKR